MEYAVYEALSAELRWIVNHGMKHPLHLITFRKQQIMNVILYVPKISRHVEPDLSFGCFSVCINKLANKPRRVCSMAPSLGDMCYH